MHSVLSRQVSPGDRNRPVTRAHRAPAAEGGGERREREGRGRRERERRRPERSINSRVEVFRDVAADLGTRSAPHPLSHPPILKVRVSGEDVRERERERENEREGEREIRGGTARAAADISSGACRRPWTGEPVSASIQPTGDKPGESRSRHPSRTPPPQPRLLPQCGGERRWFRDAAEVTRRR